MKTRKIRNKHQPHKERASRNWERNAQKNEMAVYSFAKYIDKKTNQHWEICWFLFFYLFDRISECINNLMVWPLRVETNVENGLDIKTKRFRLNFSIEAKKNAERSVLTFKGSTKTIILRNRSVFYLRIRSHFRPPQERKKNKNRQNEREKSGATHWKFLSEFCSSIDEATLFLFFSAPLPKTPKSMEFIMIN